MGAESNNETDGPAGMPSHSCSRCRRIKKKCSKEVPTCQNCAKAGKACDYPGRARRRKRKEIEEALLREAKVRTSTSTSSTGNKEEQKRPQHSLVSASSVSSFLNLLNTLNDTKRIASSSNGPDLDESTEEVSSSSPTAEPRLKRFRGKDAVASHAGLPEHEKHRSESTPITASAIQIETVLSVFKGGRTTPMKLPLQIQRPLYDRFVAAFFKHNHMSYPLLNKVDFLNKVSNIRDFNTLEEEEDYDDVFIFELYMTMAIGCTTLQRAGMLSAEEEGLSEHFSYMAMKRFCPVMHLQNLETIKCLLLLGIYSFFEPKGVSSWTISGLIMRLCIGFGLNRALTTKKLKTMSMIDVEMRYRAFWSFYSYERLVATSLGRISCLHDDDISVPLPRPLFEEENDDIEVTNMMISLRKLGGRIYRKVHSVGVGKKKLMLEEKRAIVEGLRAELDEVYKQETIKIRNLNIRANRYHEKDNNNNSRQNNNSNCISFHHSEEWLTMRYYQLQIMLYRPSVLIPKPAMDSLTILGDACLKSLKYTYSLYQRRLLPLNWITLFRVLTICNTMLYCLCQWSIDIIESKIEIHQCIEVLKHFGAKWVFAAKCADVFSNVNNMILDISLSNGRVPNMDKLTRELFGASNEYQEILDENNVDISWVDNMV